MQPDTAPKIVGRSQRETFGVALSDLADESPGLLVLDGDLATSTRADIFASRHPSRFLQMGIAEQNLVGVAAGLATQGYIPVVSTFACFIVYRALDQVRVLVAQPHLNVKFVAGYSGLLTGLTGKTHQALDDLSIMRGLPGMVVIAPADDTETRAVLRAILVDPRPTYVRLTRDPDIRVFDSAFAFEIGRTTRLRDGNDVTVFATGQQTVRVLQAAELLEQQGVAARVIHVPTIKPLDAEAVAEASLDTGLVVTSEEHMTVGGLGSAVAEVLGDHHPLPLLRLGIRDSWGESASNAELLDKHGLSPEQTARAIQTFVKGHGAV